MTSWGATPSPASGTSAGAATPRFVRKVSTVLLPPSGSVDRKALPRLWSWVSRGFGFAQMHLLHKALVHSPQSLQWRFADLFIRTHVTNCTRRNTWSLCIREDRFQEPPQIQRSSDAPVPDRRWCRSRHSRKILVSPCGCCLCSDETHRGETPQMWSAQSIQRDQKKRGCWGRRVGVTHGP